MEHPTANPASRESHYIKAVSFVSVKYASLAILKEGCNDEKDFKDAKF